MIKLGKEICANFKEAASREWIETNGIGGYCSGTVSGAGTRRYHSLLTVATKPPVSRVRTVSKLEETLIVDGERFDLSSNSFPGAVSPEGYKFITQFSLNPFPTWLYIVKGIELERKIFMVHGSNTTVCRWRVESGAERRKVQLEVRPLLAFVDHHALQHEDAGFGREFQAVDGSVRVQPYADSPAIVLCHTSAQIEATGNWYRNFEYMIEEERGFDFREDLYQPFMIRFDLDGPADMVISTENISASNVEKLERAEKRRRSDLVAKSGAKDEFASQLALAADQFIVRRGQGETVIAGYPWFSDWGRDTMISLAGLTLATGRTKIAKSILLEFSESISEGMLPNRFPDEGQQPDYNTVDATLWYFEAVRSYVEKTNDLNIVARHLYPKLNEIITWQLRGTRFGIHVDTDGLLYAGESGVQLTWMDAKVNGCVITPRTGKAVEVQALWYNAVKTMAEFAQALGNDEDVRKFESMAKLAKMSFNAVFWNDEAGCLCDVVKNGDRDVSIRPNQIFAASLKHSMLDDDRATAVVDKVEAELITPFGLRTLARREREYAPYYIGSPEDRDSAYHQGTVWPWLLGAFIDAYRRVYPQSEEHISEMLKPFAKHLSDAGLGSISEIFDAEMPFSPRGCPAQAWSVAEILRIAMSLQ
jgi:predicted glycogen debranching enzyme